MTMKAPQRRSRSKPEQARPGLLVIRRTTPAAASAWRVKSGKPTPPNRQLSAQRAGLQPWDAFFSAATAGLAIIDSQLRYVRINETLAAMNGVSVEDHLGRTVHEVLPQLGPALEMLCRKVLRTGMTLPNVEVIGEIPAEPGVARQWAVSYFPIFGARRKTEAVGAVVVEVTDLKNAQRQIRNEVTERKVSESGLRNRERQLAQAQRIANLGSWHWDLAKNTTVWSAEMYRIFGVTRREFRGTYESFLDRVHPGDRARVAQVRARAVRALQRFQNQYRIVRPDGTERIVRSEGEVTSAPGGKALEMVGVVQDITDQVAAAERLARSEEQLRALAARLQAAREDESLRISREIHDVLGQALTTLNMDLVWMQRKVGGGTQDPQSSDVLLQRLGAMEGLVKATVGAVQRISMELRPGMLDDLGLAATFEWQAQEFERRTGVPCQWRSKPKSLDLSREQATVFFRIFQEILTNIARHASARKVTLELRQSLRLVVFQVRDDGVGFDPSQLADHQSLGLLGMRERAASIGAVVEVHSTPSRGTNVRLTLPLRRSRAMADSRWEGSPSGETKR